MIFIETHTFEECENLAEELSAKNYFEVDGFWNVNELCRDIRRNINLKRFPFFCKFNGKIIVVKKEESFSDNDIWKFITGKTKEEREAEQAKQLEDYERKKMEWEEKVPSLIPKYIEAGHNVLDEKYWKLWDECVPIRLKDLYRGFDLDAFLEVVKASNNGDSFEEIKKLFDEQGHSAMSYSLVRAMYRELSDRGKEYYEWSDTKKNK